MAFQNYSECLSTFQKLKGGVKDIQKEREAFEAWLKSLNENGRTTYFLGQESTVAWEAWQAAKAQAVPEGFVSIEDKLPIDDQDVIAFDAIKHCVFKGGEFLQGYIESDTGHEYEEPVEVTHWMAVEAQEPAK